jgi:hypothetical protein
LIVCQKGWRIVPFVVVVAGDRQRNLLEVSQIGTFERRQTSPMSPVAAHAEQSAHDDEERRQNAPSADSAAHVINS